MKTSRQRVMEWINENFDTGAVELEEWGVLPGGMIVRDKNGETMYVFYNFLTDRVTYKFEGEK